MKLTLVCVLAGVLAFAVTRRSIEELARRAAVHARNHRGIQVASTGGIALVLGLLAGSLTAVLAIVPWSSGSAPLLDLPRDLVATASLIGLSGTALMFGLLGLYDDVAGDGSDRGWRAHLHAARTGRATPGAIKLVAGAAIAMQVGPAPTVPELLLTAAIIAMSANLINAFDLRPLRAAKASGIWLAALLVGALLAAEVAVIPGLIVIGAALAAMWRAEAAERIMLGDVGANALGAALGWLTVQGVVTTSARLIVTAVLLLFTVISAKPGFSAIIDGTGALRRFDRWGRQPDAASIDAGTNEPR